MLIICMTKLLDSDWLTAVQFFVKTVQKRVNSVQFTYRILAFDRLLNNRVCYEPNKPFVLVALNLLTCFGGVNTRASLPNWNLLCICNFVMYVIKNNHTTFLGQFGNNLLSCVFQKAQIAFAQIQHYFKRSCWAIMWKSGRNLLFCSNHGSGGE